MGWTNPSTWVAGAVVTAAQLNQQLRDNFKAIGDPWTAYTPSWTAATTNPTIGNGSISGAYMIAGKYCTWRWIISFGSTTTYGSGAYTVTLPSNPFAYPITFDAHLFGGSPTTSYSLHALSRQGTVALDIMADPSTAGAAWRAVTATVPVALASGMALSAWGTYQIA